MRRHADILRPKFEMVEQTLEDELGGLEIGTWTKPLGGYFISFDALEGCAKAIVAKAKEAGVVMTGAGATFPYGKDPKDSNIRIAPSYPTVEELAVAAKLFALCVKLVSVEKILESKQMRFKWMQIDKKIKEIKNKPFTANDENSVQIQNMSSPGQQAAYFVAKNIGFCYNNSTILV